MCAEGPEERRIAEERYMAMIAYPFRSVDVQSVPERHRLSTYVTLLALVPSHVGLAMGGRSRIAAATWLAVASRVSTCAFDSPTTVGDRNLSAALQGLGPRHRSSEGSGPAEELLADALTAIAALVEQSTFALEQSPHRPARYDLLVATNVARWVRWDIAEVLRSGWPSALRPSLEPVLTWSAAVAMQVGR
jgi:hypothetical protein